MACISLFEWSGICKPISSYSEVLAENSNIFHTSTQLIELVMILICMLVPIGSLITNTHESTMYVKYISEADLENVIHNPHTLNLSTTVCNQQ